MGGRPHGNWNIPGVRDRGARSALPPPGQEGLCALAENRGQGGVTSFPGLERHMGGTRGTPMLQQEPSRSTP